MLTEKIFYTHFAWISKVPEKRSARRHQRDNHNHIDNATQWHATESTYVGEVVEPLRWTVVGALLQPRAGCRPPRRARRLWLAPPTLTYSRRRRALATAHPGGGHARRGLAAPASTPPLATHAWARDGGHLLELGGGGAAEGRLTQWFNSGIGGAMQKSLLYKS